ncbi:SulP family inorganic anion transporter [Rugamonas apoptosis]|uniref:STAS domain-containing protein n=1 Tax=Rugamonas apoptosis TaxID=2758570 RepID=A0A7W2IM17_9BURK|nr:SulP family inorganic anion transporter [Rugamonas apoptosis]MBA5689071.1 STAS domain-containing protein [Rugamonas apoptosis]
MISIVAAHRAGLFARSQLLRNVVAGVIVGVVALPLAMAFAIASGARPEQGLYTAIVAGALVSACGGTRAQIAGPTGAFIAILAGVTARYGIDGLQVATLMAGLMLVAMGFAGMGAVIRFIPAPVIVGFTAGIGVIIWVGQWKYFFGLHPVEASHFHEKLWNLIQILPQLHLATTALAVLSLLLVLLSPRVPGLRHVPGPLVAMVVTTLVYVIFRFDGVATIGSAFGGIPQQLPGFKLPSVTLARFFELISPAFTIAMLGAIESLLSAVVADGMAGTRHDSNQELIGQGLANIAAPLFGGFAATGAIARTATSIRNGGSSPLAGIVHAATLVLIILALAPLAASVPLAALAAILFVVAYNMSEIKHFARMVRRAPRADVVILIITFLLTVFADLVVAVNIGVIMATMHFLRRMSTSVEVQSQTDKQLAQELAEQGLPALPPGVLVYGIEGPVFFGAVENFERALIQTHTEPHILIIRLRHVPFMDITGIQTLEEVVRKMQTRGVRVLLCEANERVKAKLDKADLFSVLGPSDYQQEFGAALERCKAEIGEGGRKRSAVTLQAEKLVNVSKHFFADKHDS